MNTEVAHFSVTGEFVTEHFRTLVSEGNWRDGFNGLRDSFDDISVDLVIDILSGKKKLTGVNDLTVEDDDLYLDEEWVDDQYYTYSNNAIMHYGKVYKAYALVETLVMTDMEEAKRKMQVDITSVRDGSLNRTRALTYANNPGSDITEYYEGVGWVLFEESRDTFPFWLSTSEMKTLMEKQGIPSMVTRYNSRVEGHAEYTAEDDAVKEQNDKIAEAAISNFMKNQEMVDDVLDDLDGLKERIAKQADENGGWLELKNGNETYTLPKNAFYRWCLGNSSARTMIDWTPVSPKGMKMGMDDPNHTDWWLFTGYTLDQSYCNDLTDYFFEQRYEIQRKLTNHEFVTLLRGTATDNSKPRTVRHTNITNVNDIQKGDVVVIPTASPDYEQVAHKCAELDAILITETGGKLCHLATVGREFGLTMLMIPDAMRLFPEGSTVIISIENGEISAQDLPVEQVVALKMSGDF